VIRLPPAVSPRDLGSSALLVRAGIAAVVTSAFTLFARWMNGVNRSGAIAGAIVAFVLYFSAGPGAFVALLSVFALTVLATRFGYARKRMLGVAEKQGGRRASQVIANLAVATVAAAVFGIFGAPIALIAMAAALAEAATDTVSSECGQALASRARLITNWQAVPAGTDGGISLPGTVAGMVAGLAVAAICALAGQIPRPAIATVWVSAMFGMLFDSVLGGSLERSGRLNNDQVNFLGTAAAAIVSLPLAYIFS
jgi:uncharacterized protein (TIGR00297 family)